MEADFFSVFPLILYNKLSSRQGRDNIYIHVNVKRCVPLAVSERLVKQGVNEQQAGA